MRKMIPGTYPGSFHMRSVALGPATGLADVASALELEFGTALGTGVLDDPLDLFGLLSHGDALDLGL